MLPIVMLLLAAVSAPHVSSFEITTNKPFVQVKVDGSAPLWFILDTGDNGPSIVARECADRLRLARGAAAKVDVGAGSGADVELATARHPVLLEALGETLTVAEPRVLTLGHVARVEGRRLDGLLGSDFLARHVVQIDYERRTITLRDPNGYEPGGGVVIPLDLETGWPIVEGSITMPGGRRLACRLIVDTGVRGTVTMFRPFSARHGLHDAPGNLHDLVIGFGAGGISRGDVARIEAIDLGALSFPRPVAVFSRDTSGVFMMDGPDGIVGGELLRRHRVTFDYPHRRMILEPYTREPDPFVYDMSGLFLGTDAPDYAAIRIIAVNPNTPAAEAGLREGDEIVSIDGRATPSLTLDRARALLRTPGTRTVELRREGQTRRMSLALRRLV